MKLDGYANNLSLMVEVCKSTLGTIENIKNKTIVLPDNGTIREEIAQIMTEFLVIKLYCLFDDSGNALSFEKITEDCKEDLSQEKIKQFKDLYLAIKRKYAPLINRIKNNRNISIAHNGKRGVLGWDGVTLSKLKAIWGDTLKDASPVHTKYVYFTTWNYPVDETKKMLEDLRKLIYQFWFPDSAIVL